MNKSSKRIKLENEIFSKSIKDIELMFNFSYDQEAPARTKRKFVKTTGSRNDIPLSANRLEQKIPEVQLDILTGLGAKHIEMNYDCVNMSFFSDSQSESDEEAPSVLALNQLEGQPSKFLQQVAPETDLLSGRNIAIAPIYASRNQAIARTHHNVVFDLNDDDEIDGYSFELDLKQYLPRTNLESDLKRIDQMFAAPSLLTKIS